jgi:hypothetical protein
LQPFPERAIVIGLHIGDRYIGLAGVDRAAQPCFLQSVRTDSGLDLFVEIH